MFDIDRWQEILHSIWTHKLRTFLTALGVFWGIFMLVILMGSGKGLENGVYQSIGDIATNSLYMWTNRTSMPYEGLQAGRRIALKYEDLQAMKRSFNNKVDYMAPRYMVQAGQISRNGKSGDFDVRGEVPDILYMEPIRLASGRFINGKDIKERRKSIVIGQYIADLLFEDSEEVIGNDLEIMGIEFKVVGTFKSGRKGEDGANDEKSIMMPLTTAQQITNRPDIVHWAIVTMKKDVMVSEVEDQFIGFLKEKYKVHPDDNQGIGHFNLEEEFREIEGLFFGIRSIVWLVGIGSLLAGIIGVGNIMLIAVKERTKEIGLRKALGATPGSIIAMIIQESVFITFLAGYIGLLISTGLIFLLETAVGEGGEFFANPEVDFTVAFGALLILILAGALTGLLPAIRAVQINPVVALKDE